MHILIVRNNSNPQAIDASLLLVSYLNSQSIHYTILDSSTLALEKVAQQQAELRGLNPDLAVVLGGDGTILRTARLVNECGTPILGINFGHLGFLANSSEDGVVKILAAALAGDVVREKRSNLCVDVAFAGEDFSLDSEDDASDEDTRTCQRCFFALNELAITRGAMGHIIDFELHVAGVSLADMRGDGVVVATATGSTAYALSAGGPLVAPGFDGLVVVPLAPHTLHSRALVTAGNDVVEIDLSRNPDPWEATLFVDGELIPFETTPERICIRKGPLPTILLRYKHDGFYEHAAEAFFGK